MTLQLSVSPNDNVPFDVLYEDEHMIALNKPSGVVTQPGKKHWGDSLLNGAFSRWGRSLQNLGKKRDFGLLHRLDRGTSGIVLIALSIDGYTGLRTHFEQRTIRKVYWAMVSGLLSPQRGRCDFKIEERIIRGQKRAWIDQSKRFRHHAGSTAGRSPKQSKRPQQTKQHARSQQASTLYETLDHAHSSHGVTSLVRCELLTGRLHQIRAHLNALGCPVVGDFDYGGARPINRYARQIQRDMLALHAQHIAFKHPVTQEPILISAPLSATFNQLLTECNLSRARCEEYL